MTRTVSATTEEHKETASGPNSAANAALPSHDENHLQENRNSSPRLQSACEPFKSLVELLRGLEKGRTRRGLPGQQIGPHRHR
eukprot:767444-Hanusia_phi.AAC.2